MRDAIVGILNAEFKVLGGGVVADIEIDVLLGDKPGEGGSRQELAGFKRLERGKTRDESSG